MANINESVKKGSVMTMTLKCETEFPKALKNTMLSMGMQGEAIYKGFPVIDKGQEYWWVQLHLYKNKEDDPKKMGLWMFTNSEMYPSFLDSARSTTWKLSKNLEEDSIIIYTPPRRTPKMKRVDYYLEDIQEALVGPPFKIYVRTTL
jgi:hypothetical protein